MPEQTTEQPNRLDRRKARTRAALIRAARACIAAGRTNVPILEITQSADVGMGSFYNHFDTKEDLFHAAVEDALDAIGDMLDALTATMDDPAEVVAQSFRLLGRIHRREPELSKVLLHHGLSLTGFDRGVARRARRDLEAAAHAGRFPRVTDAEATTAIVAGAVLAIGQLLHDQPERDDAETTDQITEDLLRMFGVPADEARDISRRPLPDLDELPRSAP
ncbi:TetR/AcrR family transcriptional regulator [Kutzneria sp. CA-103260]|uniref:TetR/AcrR family transcriptional regulator n=1 Tax=Kutzneria sp. CA-103260 TaxID=2802641 RepID=UPI001BAD66AF|nr:TetR/AcrR family transcriptional regulator [Kutzneria sp. CA-103260]QUQ70058.1 TetR family transcriptional regulator [Kutzneria sp. CA-103260]